MLILGFKRKYNIELSAFTTTGSYKDNVIAARGRAMKIRLNEKKSSRNFFYYLPSSAS